MENGNTNQQNFNQNQFNQPQNNQPQNYGPAPSIPGMGNYKSATVAGLLGIFLGSIGIHDFYLGDKQKGIKHVILASVWVVADTLSGIILPNILSFRALLAVGWLLSILGVVGGICIAISSIWGLVDGIKILTAGDAGLARRGIPVAPQQSYGQNYNNYTQAAPNQMPNMNQATPQNYPDQEQTSTSGQEQTPTPDQDHTKQPDSQETTNESNGSQE